MTFGMDIELYMFASITVTNSKTGMSYDNTAIVHNSYQTLDPNNLFRKCDLITRTWLLIALAMHWLNPDAESGCHLKFPKIGPGSLSMLNNFEDEWVA